ncbi:hypothetical protein IJG14_06360, partial [bacterium]|nr:hypothetical protein [bacterium]
MKNFINKIIQNFINFFTKERLIGILLFCCLTCIVVMFNLLLPSILKPVDLTKYSLNSYTLSFFNPYKYITFIQYGVSIVFIALFSACSFWLYKKNLIEKIKIRTICVPFFVLFTIFSIFVNTEKVSKIIALIFIFILLLFSCFDIDINNRVCSKVKKTSNIIFSIFSLAVIVQFFFIFYPFIFEKIKILNEFFDIPEITLIKTSAGGTLEIDNINFINKNHIMGYHNKYDLRNPNVKDNIPCFSVNDKVGFLRNIKIQSYDKDIMNINNNLDFANDSYYFNRNNQICLIGQVNDKDIENITQNRDDIQTLKNIQKKIHYDFLQQINDRKISKFFILENPVLYKIEKDFTKNNAHEIHWQILNRYYIHHQNHLIAPINEIMTGKDINTIFFQYGKFNALIISKILEKIGGFDFTKYMQVTYSFYY